MVFGVFLFASLHDKTDPQPKYWALYMVDNVTLKHILLQNVVKYSGTFCVIHREKAHEKYDEKVVYSVLLTAKRA